MNKKQAQKELDQIKDRVKELEKIIHESEDKTKEMSDFLLEMFNKVNRQKITGEKELTCYIDDKWLYQQDYKNGKLWIRYLLIWKVFESRFNLNYNQIRDFIQGWVETNLGWKGLTPFIALRRTAFTVETNLGWKGLTPGKIKS